jgi:tol-pal system protein YbgF
MQMRSFLAPVLALSAAGCLASKGDIRLLQDDLTSMRAQHAQQAQAQERARARDDSLTRVRLDSALRAIGSINDSLRTLSARFMTYQANSSQSLYALGQQIVTLQNRAGISQRQIQDLAAQVETRGAPAGGGAAPTPAKVDSSAPQAPGPARLYQLARDQYNNGAYSTARLAFRQILTTYPTYANASLVALSIGSCYEGEKNQAAADSVYLSVVKQYPQSPDAPTALFKYGASQLTQGKVDAARAAWERVIKEYPNSDAATLATGRLKTLPSK